MVNAASSLDRVEFRAAAAKPRRELQVLRAWLAPDTDTRPIVEAAAAVARRWRIVRGFVALAAELGPELPPQRGVLF